MPSVKIDLITHDPRTDEFALILVEDGPWSEEASDWNECLSRIQARIFDAIDVAIDGHLAKIYPESKGKRVRVQIDSPHGAPRLLVQLISKVREHTSNPKSKYGAAIRRSPYVKTLHIAMGPEFKSP